MLIPYKTVLLESTTDDIKKIESLFQFEKYTNTSAQDVKNELESKRYNDTIKKILTDNIFKKIDYKPIGKYEGKANLLYNMLVKKLDGMYTKLDDSVDTGYGWGRRKKITTVRVSSLYQTNDGYILLALYHDKEKYGSSSIDIFYSISHEETALSQLSRLNPDIFEYINKNKDSFRINDYDGYASQLINLYNDLKKIDFTIMMYFCKSIEKAQPIIGKLTNGYSVNKLFIEHKKLFLLLDTQKDFELLVNYLIEIKQRS